MKKPYIKKIGEFSGFKVWYVNGYWIRKHVNRDFSNFGQHFRFNFIPKNELWIDKEASKRREVKYFIQRLLVEYRLMEKGKSYYNAVSQATKIEKVERGKLKQIQKLGKEKTNKEKIIKKIHKRFLKRLSDEIKVWVVRGDLVRGLFYTDFTQGGHDKIYRFIPAGEVWIDDDVYYKEIPFILVHELYERHLMSKGMSYDEAHDKANQIEYFCRHHPKKLKKRLKLELKRNKL